MIQTASLFVHGETFNQKELMLFRQIVSIHVAGCVISFILVHWISVFLATPARTTNKTHLNTKQKPYLKICMVRSLKIGNAKFQASTFKYQGEEMNYKLKLKALKILIGDYEP